MLDRAASEGSMAPVDVQMIVNMVEQLSRSYSERVEVRGTYLGM
jgi:hypothetical protein